MACAWALVLCHEVVLWYGFALYAEVISYVTAGCMLKTHEQVLLSMG
jgi:hypothetical protein